MRELGAILKGTTLMTNRRQILMALGLVAATALPMSTMNVDSARAAATAGDLDRDANNALQMLYRTNPAAMQLSKTAKAVLVFPNIVKAGLVFGGSYGEGVLKKGPQTIGYYNSASASWGLQAGAQSYGYAVFLMTDKAVDYLNKTKGWEIGVGPTVVVGHEDFSHQAVITTEAKRNGPVCRDRWAGPQL